jgi:hypothetical protein
MGSKKIHKKEDKKFRDFAYLDNRPATPLNSITRPYAGPESSLVYKPVR